MKLAEHVAKICPDYSREERFDWFEQHPFEKHDMDVVIPLWKEEFAENGLRQIAAKRSFKRNAWKSHLFQMYGNYRVAILFVRWPLAFLSPENIYEAYATPDSP